MTLQQMLNSAADHHRAGRLQQAEKLYRAILAEQPYHADALHLLGVLANQTGHHEDACQWINKAIAQRPVAEYYFNLAGALISTGKFDESIVALRQAIAMKPNWPAAHANLGTLLQRAGNLDEAIACFHKAIALDPRNHLWHYNLGNACMAAQKNDQAIAAFNQAILINPNYPEALNNLGSTLHALGRFEEAVEKGRRALAINPNFVEALNNVGNSLINLSRFEEAVEVFLRAVALNPNLAVVHNNLGNVLCGLGRYPEAIDAYRQAIALQPHWPEALNNLSIALRSVGDIDAALAAAREALAERPGFILARENEAQALQLKGEVDQAIEILEQLTLDAPQDSRIFNTLGNALRSIGQLDRAIAAYQRSAELDPTNYLPASNYLFTLQFHIEDPAVILAAHQNWNTQFTSVLAPSPCIQGEGRDGGVERTQNAERRTLKDPHPTPPQFDSAHCGPEYKGRELALTSSSAFRVQRSAFSDRLRIAYLSPDFRHHCQSLFTTALFPHHDHEQFEIFCYSLFSKPDSITERLRACANTWRDVAFLSDAAIAEQIRKDEIDILIDLTMHMGNCRPLIHARKPAPIQACWLAYPGTTGMATMDYRLSDPHLDPAGWDIRYSEKTIRLPDTFWCYNPHGMSFDPAEALPEVNDLPALTNGYVTFGCLNDFSKINSATLNRWTQIMRKVPHSHLRLLIPTGQSRQRVADAFSTFGISTDRLEFVDRQERTPYLAEYHKIDLCLDTLPYNGHTTSLDAFWMGVPVLTQIGKTVVGRAGLSQLTNLRLPQFVAESEEQFHSRAIEWAKNLDGLAEIRRTLRERMNASPLMDAKKFAHDIETAFRNFIANL
ncbi:MAG TPA: tetratricopeptide repeat protein [Tepidisphaeraceae bacterium]